MNGKAKILDGKGNLVGSGKQTKGNLFYLDLSESSCFITQIEERWLWHKRLCHVKFNNLIKIRRKKTLGGIPCLRKPDMSLCKNCQISKMRKKIFKNKDYHFEEVLELVHTDLCGPIEIESYNGDKYIYIFDDYSRMMTIMYLKEKSKAFEKFKCYLARVEKETRKKLKCLRSNRGSEFISN